MKLFKKLTTITPLSKFIALTLFIILPFLGFYLGIRYQELDSTAVKTSQYQSQITKEQAENLIKNLPEVKNFLKSLDGNKAGFFVNAEDRKDNYWYIQVAEVVVDSKADEEYMSHTVTFNWYKVDRSSGRIICSMTNYDKDGELIKIKNLGDCF